MVIGGVHFTTDESESITQVVLNEGTEDEKVLQVGGGNDLYSVVIRLQIPKTINQTDITYGYISDVQFQFITNINISGYNKSQLYDFLVNYINNTSQFLIGYREPSIHTEDNNKYVISYRISRLSSTRIEVYLIASIDGVIKYVYYSSDFKNNPYYGASIVKVLKIN